MNTYLAYLITLLNDIHQIEMLKENGNKYAYIS